MISGFVEAKYDKNEGQIANLDDVFDGGSTWATSKPASPKSTASSDFTIPGVESFALNDNGDLVITDSNNQPHVVTLKIKPARATKATT